MVTIYPDHNFVIEAHDAPVEYREALNRRAVTYHLKYVLSPMHWVDMAEDVNLPRSRSLADFVDSLRPSWLYDRRGLQRREVATAFFEFAGVPHSLPGPIETLGEVIRDLIGISVERNTRDFVAHLRQIGNQHPLRQSLTQAFETNRSNGARFRNGTISIQQLADIERLYISQLLPDTTPGGLVIDNGTKQAFLNQYDLRCLPAFLLETKITRDNWSLGRHLTRNNFLDQQHAMSLPYVRFFVTDDLKLRRLIERTVAEVPFPTARVINKAQFDLQFP